jgi:hypothetical protein
MISNSIKVNIDAPGIAIICNAWAELNQDIHLKSFQTTLSCIVTRPSIQSVLLAATHVTLTKETQGLNSWYDNSKTIFVDQQGVDYIRRLWHVAISSTANSSFCHHNVLIRDHDYQGRPCIAIWEQWQLEWLLNHYFANIQNVWYFGAGLGVRRDPFGWAQLCDLIKHQHVRPVNILTHKFGMLNNRQNSSTVEKSDFEYIDWHSIPNWQFISEDILVKTDLEWS